MRGRDAPVSAVSEPEKKADSNKSTTIAITIRTKASLMSGWFHLFYGSCSYGLFEDSLDVAQIDIARDKGIADPIGEHKNRPSLSHFLVDAD